MFPFIFEDVTHYTCTTMYDDEVKYNDCNVYYTRKYLQNNCATRVNEEGEYDGNRGTCGASCPREDEDDWVTDDTLTVTHHYDTSHDDTDSLQYSDFPDTLLVTSNSSAAQTWPRLMGVYTKTNKTNSGRPVWRNIINFYQLYFSGN